MNRWIVPTLYVALFLASFPAQSAEITEVCDAADGDDPIDINLDIQFRSMLNRSKITHEWKPLWGDPQFQDRPDFNELRFDRQVYAMDYMLEVGLYHDVQLYVNLPWIISDTREISFVSGQDNSSSTLFRTDPQTFPEGYRENSLAVDPSTKPSTTRAGIGDIQMGVKWAAFNDERDDTKSVWIIGLDYTIPSGQLAQPDDIINGQEGDVGLGQHVLTPFMLFSHRYSILDPYVGLHGSIPIPGREARNEGFRTAYHGGFLTGLEIVPWENLGKFQKFAIDVRLTAEFFGEVESKGSDKNQGTVTELSDFLISPSGLNGERQLQAVSNFANFGLHLGFIFRAAEFVRFRFGVSLAHDTEHFISGADHCIDSTGDGSCDDEPDANQNGYRASIYDNPGRRIRIEETTLFTWWVMGMMTF